MRHLALLTAFAFSFSAQAAKPSAKKPPQKRMEKPFFTDAVAGCPRSLKDWQAQGPKLLVTKAMHQHAPVEITDFTEKLGKKDSGATARVTPFHGQKSDGVFVQANDEKEQLFLSGVLRCDVLKHAPVLVSLTYVKGTQSGLVNVVDE
jgi:hypothetical protein